MILMKRMWINSKGVGKKKTAEPSFGELIPFAGGSGKSRLLLEDPAANSSGGEQCPAGAHGGQGARHCTTMRSPPLMKFHLLIYWNIRGLSNWVLKKGLGETTSSVSAAAKATFDTVPPKRWFNNRTFLKKRKSGRRIALSCCLER